MRIGSPVAAQRTKSPSRSDLEIGIEIAELGLAAFRYGLIEKIHGRTDNPFRPEFEDAHVGLAEPFAYRFVAMTHEQLLDAYARLTVRPASTSSSGQQLLITAPLDAVPLVRRITEHAYKAGASLVTAIYPTTQRRWRATASRQTTASTRRPAGSSTAWRRPSTAARRGSPSRARTRRCWPARIPRRCRAPTRPARLAYRPALELITGFAINWCVVACATPAWAKLGVPGLTEESRRVDQAVATRSSPAPRADLPDPVAAWEEHNRDLRRRTRLPERAPLSPRCKYHRARAPT